jgi:hypothetical protein
MGLLPDNRLRNEMDGQEDKEGEERQGNQMHSARVFLENF